MERTTNWKHMISFLCYAIFLLISFVYALVYLSRTEFMPYHAVMLEQDWSELSIKYQNLILGLMRALGAGWLSLSIVMGFLLFKPFREGRKWAYWAIPVSALPAVLANLYIVMNMILVSPASPPWLVVVFNAILLLTGFFLSVTERSDVNNAQGI